MLRLLPYAVLLAEVLAFYRKILFWPAQYVIPWDLRYYHLSIAQFLARSFQRGELPLWDPYTYCGFPIYADLTAGVFYPPMLVALLLSNLSGGGHLLYFLELQVVAHTLLAGIFTYWLLRRLGAGVAAALAGGTVYQLGAFFASQAQHLGAVSSAAWMPLAWLAVIELHRGIAWRPAARLAFALSMSVLAGFPAETAVVFASCALLCAVLMISGRARPRTAWVVAGACVWALWLSAMQLLPTIELTRQSVAALRSEWLGTGSGMPWQALASLLVPNYWGVFEYDPSTHKLPWNPTFLYVYCGIPALLLAVWAVARRVRFGGVFAVVAVASAVAMLGDRTAPGQWLLAGLPAVMRGSLYPEFALAAFVLGLAVLAGLGANALIAARSRVWKAALVGVIALDLVAVSSGRRINTADLQSEAGIGYNHFGGIREIPTAVRRLVNQTVPPSRVDTMQGSIFWSQGAPLFETPTANGNYPFALVTLMQVRLKFCQGKRWGRYFEVFDPGSPVLDKINVRYLISNNRIPKLAPKYRHVASLPGQEVYENTAALPRFYLEAGKERRQVKVRSYASRRILLETDCPMSAELVTSETHYPGWHASVDDREVPIHTTGGAFRGLRVPAGRHRIEMWFAPAILWRSLALSALGWVVLAVAWVRGASPPEGARAQ